MEWKEFSRDSIRGHSYVWLTDGKNNCLAFPSLAAYWKDHWTHFMIIEEPELPKQVHNCFQGDLTCHFLGRYLTLSYQRENEDSEHFIIVCCPFCGFSSKKD